LQIQSLTRELYVNTTLITHVINFHTNTFPYNVSIDASCSFESSTFNYQTSTLPSWLTYIS